ncbi:MAG TPA: alpha-glucosidase C-terminal domain-containing protein, partial [Saprospiraceae bacterium]|nr:alpha-glucosidase C-terminal domain-containing protein [Saprospiraceae bacterium]
PMIYCGQEDASAQRLAFFKQDPIRWKDYAKSGFFQKLGSLKRSNRALDAGPKGGPLVKIPTDADDAVYAFMREKNGDRVIVVLNLSKQARTVTLRFDNAALGDYMSLFVATTVQVTKEMTLTLKPWEYLVLTNR